MSTPRKPKIKMIGSKTDQLELPEKVTSTRLEPGGTRNPQKDPSDKNEEQFAALHQILADIQADMATNDKQYKEDKTRFKQLHRECRDMKVQVVSSIEDFKADQIHRDEEHETMTETLNTKIQNLGNSSSISHRRMDKIEKKQEQILRDLSSQNLMLIEYNRDLT